MASAPAAAGATVTASASGTARRYEFDGDVLDVTPLGGGAEVGRSCVVVKFRGKTVMFDCGIHPAHSGMSTLPYFDHISPAEVDLLLVTHFHLDHSGSVPYFVERTEFKGRVFMTHPTRPICRMLWHDYARVSKIAAEDQIFSPTDIENALKKVELVDFHEERHYRGIKFTCFGAGHVLGAAMFLIDIGGIRVLYTGDYSREKDRHLPQAEIPSIRSHVLIVESTYGVQIHEPRDQREHRFTNSVHQIVRQGGKCLLPVFALGRAQEILLILEDYWERNSDLHSIPIYYNSPMATKCLRIFESYTGMCSDKVQEQANRCRNPWMFKYIKNMPERNRFMSAEAELGPCVVLAAPGMLQSGASRELFESWAPDKRNGIIVTGYSVQGTLAHELKSEPDQVTLADGRKIHVRATIKFISFSAHSDYGQTAEFIRRLRSNVVVLVHGEETEMNRMKAKLREDYADLNVCNPQNCQTVQLRVPADRACEAVGAVAEDVEAAEVPPRKRREVAALLIDDDDTSTRLVVSPDEVAEYTKLNSCTVEQAQKLAFPLPLSALGRSLRDMYDDLKVTEEGLLVCDCVRVSLKEQVLETRWLMSPLADMVADSVVYRAVELVRSRSTLQAIQPTEDVAAREDRLFAVLLSSLELEFGKLEVDAATKVLRFRADGNDVKVDFVARTVDCEDQDLQERIRLNLRRCETAMRPIPCF